jgi:outer membrane protein assembly factor BamA
MASLKANDKDISFFNQAEKDTTKLYASKEKTKKDTTSDDSVEIFTGQYDSPDSSDNAEMADLSDYVFGPQNVRQKDSDEEQIPREKVFEEKLDENGNYLVNKYKIRFSPDLVYANAGYSTLYGLLGTTVLSFSDILGNHRLIGITSMQMDLKNSDYGLAYYYLRDRMDFGVEGFHTARFVYLRGGRDRDLYRFRNYGGVVSASYPINRFYRFDGSLSLFRVSSENLDDIRMENDIQNYVVPAVSFVHDNTFFGYTSPIEGTRYNLTVFGNPGVGDHTKSFYSVNWDYRKYFRFWYDNMFAFRVSGGYSGGANPQRFFMGGTSNWINRNFATGEIPLDDASDFAFLSPAMPMRGFDYAEQIGSKYSLLNMEFRMPFIRYLLTGPLPILFQNILATGFVDMGTAWNDSDKLQLFTEDENSSVITKDLLIGTGVGARVFFLGFLVRFDVGWSFDAQSFSKPKYYLSLGTDF